MRLVPVLGLIVAIAAIYFGYDYIGSKGVAKPAPKFRKESYVANLFQTMSDYTNIPWTMKCSKVALGYNANLDMIIPYHEFFRGLKIPKIQNYSDHSVITNITDLYETFGHFFVQGAAAERYVEKPFWEEVSHLSNIY
jgi:hypothetical protein